MKGLFITFEGGEGAGKTTLIERVNQYLSASFRVVQTREPGGTDLGEKIRDLLLTQQQKEPLSAYAELALFLASRAQNIQQFIRPALEKGDVVLCDRFNDSSFAYQGIARGLGVDKVERVAEFFCEDLKPDLTFYLDLDPSIGFERMKEEKLDRIESEKIEFHLKVRQAYHSLAKRFENRLFIIDASQSPDQVFNDALGFINKHLKTHQY